jgi:hypothetical protein
VRRAESGTSKEDINHAIQMLALKPERKRSILKPEYMREVSIK